MSLHRRADATAYQGSNSWIILSKRMTANNRELKPASHASASTKNAIKLFQPPRFDSAERISPLTTSASAILPTQQFGTVSILSTFILQEVNISTTPDAFNPAIVT